MNQDRLGNALWVGSNTPKATSVSISLCSLDRDYLILGIGGNIWMVHTLGCLDMYIRAHRYGDHRRTSSSIFFCRHLLQLFIYFFYYRVFHQFRSSPLALPKQPIPSAGTKSTEIFHSQPITLLLMHFSKCMQPAAGGSHPMEKGVLPYHTPSCN